MSLTRDDVKHLAELARLELTENEIKSAEKDLDKILGYVNRLKKVETKGVEPVSMPAKAQGWRDDRALPCDDVARETILANFPDRKGELLATPGVFERPKGK